MQSVLNLLSTIANLPTLDASTHKRAVYLLRQLQPDSFANIFADLKRGKGA